MSSQNIFGKAIVVVALIIGVIFGKTIGQKTTGLISSIVGAIKTLGTYPESAWSSRAIGEITLDAPFRFETGPDIRAQLPAEVQKVLLKYETQVSEKPNRFFQANVARLEYAPAVPTSIDGAAEGAIKEVAGNLGDKAPKFTITPGKLDGLISRQSSYHYETATESVYIDSIFAQKGQVVWQISVVYEKESFQPEILRLLKSIHIEPAS